MLKLFYNNKGVVFMSRFEQGKYVKILAEILNRDQLIALAKRFGLSPSGSDIHLKIHKSEEGIVVYEEISNAVFSDILTSVAFKDFTVRPENAFEGTIEYVKAQMEYRNVVADLVRDSHPEYNEDFAMFLLEKERQISQKCEEAKHADKMALEQELGLAVGEFAPTK